MSAVIGIVGAGFSGTMLAVHLSRLARRSGAEVRIVLWEQGPTVARGRAYSTNSPRHLLNVPAERMSAFPDQPGHFAEWARARDASAAPGAYLPRRLYGDYLQEILDGAIRESRGRLSLRAAEVEGIDPERAALRVRLRSGTSELVDRVVLATGHPLPGPPLPLDATVLESGLYRADPWDPRSVEGLSDSSDLLLIGSGLTAIDVVLEARSSGFRGTTHTLSRRGLLPLSHAAHAAAHSTPPLEFPTPRVLAMMRTLRVRAARERKRGADWRVVVDALRPITQELWRSLPISEQRRFLRHVRPYWEIHRHRVAPRVAAEIERELQSGSVVRHAGAMASVENSEGGLRVTVRRRGRGQRYALVVQRIVNCTGPNTQIEMNRAPLTRTLLAGGLCRPDRLGIGIACDPEGAVIDASGRITRKLFALGPLRKGELWESTAVAELRVQAERLATRLVGELEG